jgi:Tol biopolymer transport system component
MLVSDAGSEVLILSDWSRDGKTLFYATGLQTGDQTAWALPLEGERKPRLIVDHAVDATLSPNGRWLAYTLLSGQAEVYVARNPSWLSRSRTWETRSTSEPARR